MFRHILLAALSDHLTQALTLSYSVYVSQTAMEPETVCRMIQVQMEQIEVLTSHRDLNSLCSMRRSSQNSRVTMVACRGVLSRTDSPNAVPVPSVHILTACCNRNRDVAPHGSFLHKDKKNSARQGSCQMLM